MGTIQNWHDLFSFEHELKLEHIEHIGWNNASSLYLRGTQLNSHQRHLTSMTGFLCLLVVSRVPWCNLFLLSFSEVYNLFSFLPTFHLLLRILLMLDYLKCPVEEMTFPSAWRLNEASFYVTQLETATHLLNIVIWWFYIRLTINT